MTYVKPTILDADGIARCVLAILEVLHGDVTLSGYLYASSI